MVFKFSSYGFVDLQDDLVRNLSDISVLMFEAMQSILQTRLVAYVVLTYRVLLDDFVQ